MSFPSYADYTESQLEYIGPIPSSWDLMPFFSRFIERKESNKGMKNDNLLSLSYGRIIPKDINSLDGLLPASYETYQLVRPGDLVFRLTDLQNDKRSLRSAIVTGEGIITSAYLAVRPKAMNPAFASHLFRCYDQLKVFYSMGGGLRQSMKYDDMKWLPVVSPSLPEQAQIARFLDHETAKIDALIAEQKRLIKLLQEKRQAVISHAVTKGLDPNVPMKDSGVEWLGEVPAHWVLASLRRAIKSISNGTTSPQIDESEKTYPVTRIESISKGTIDFERVGHVQRSDTAQAFILEHGDILLSHINSLAMVGNVAIYDDSRPLLHGMNLLRIQPERSSIDSYWLLYWLKSELVRQNIESRAKPAINQASISTGSIKDILIPLIPLKEQIRIANFIDRQTAKFDELGNQALKSIELMKERRAALISAAVTGKIDVRDWQPPADESAFDEDVRKAGVEASA